MATERLKLRSNWMNTVEVDMLNIHQSVRNANEDQRDRDHIDDSLRRWEESLALMCQDRLQKAHLS